jgi:hypothetical protein
MYRVQETADLMYLDGFEHFYFPDKFVIKPPLLPGVVPPKGRANWISALWNNRLSTIREMSSHLCESYTPQIIQNYCWVDSHVRGVHISDWSSPVLHEVLFVNTSSDNFVILKQDNYFCLYWMYDDIISDIKICI